MDGNTPSIDGINGDIWMPLDHSPIPMKFAIFDTETNGLTLPRIADASKQPRIIDIGVRIVNSIGEIIIDMEQLINPEIQINEETTKITGITNEMLAGQTTFKTIAPQLANLF